MMGGGILPIALVPAERPLPLHIGTGAGGVGGAKKCRHVVQLVACTAV